jgi:hypothetical protein
MEGFFVTEKQADSYTEIVVLARTKWKMVKKSEGAWRGAASPQLVQSACRNFEKLTTGQFTIGRKAKVCNGVEQHRRGFQRNKN